jgi:alpha-glucosidase
MLPGGASGSLAWWQKAVVYQIYPHSFQDSDGDGVGDLEGIRRRLDHLSWLGIDAVWISPFYRSPMVDFGYDVSDFCDVDPLFGTLDDFDRVVAEAHERGIRVILDYVPNHTSDKHAWFAESRSSRTNPKRDWYIWRDASPDGSPPTNWVSNFGGSAWRWDDATDQFYYHAFLNEQPDLNWRNPAVRRAMLDVLRFWLGRGVDGFRVDAITNLVEDDLLRDDPPNPRQEQGIPDAKRLKRVFAADRPETHGFVADLRAVLDEAGDRVLIGEAHLPVARVMAYYGGKRPGFHLPFNFLLLHTPWHARSVEAAIDQYTILLPEGAWPNWVLGNHDEPRVASRIGEAQARVAAMLIMTLRGTPFVYYGDEIGLPNTPITDDGLRDPVSATLGQALGRDPQRTPMPWDESNHAGFTTGRPWLPLGPDQRMRNLARMRSDERSILHLYRRLIALRRREPALAEGAYEPVGYRRGLLGYRRRARGQDLSIVLNLDAAGETANLSHPGRILLSTHLDRSGETVPSWLDLRPDEGVVVEHS